MSWENRFFQSSRGKIIRLLRQTGRTVNELSAVLKLTDNAIRAHLATLERDGLVRTTGQQKGTRKPNTTYGLTDEAERLFPKSMATILTLLLDVLAARMTREEIEEVIREVGHRAAAAHLKGMEGLSLPERAIRATELLREMGGLAEVDGADPLKIQGHSCPLGEIVPGHPEVCLAVETMLSDLLGTPVNECCRHGTRPQCCFEVKRAG